jgi:RecA-family ATPase
MSAEVPPGEVWQNGSPPGPFEDDMPPKAKGADGETETSPWDRFVTPAPDDWFTEQPPRRLWLLRDSRTDAAAGVLPLGKVGQLVAEGGAGKTMALAQLALAVATGSRWLDTFEVAPEGVGRVLLALGEEDAEEVRRRFYNAARLANIKPPAGSIVTLPLAGATCPMIERGADGNPIEAPFLLWLRAMLGREHDWRLVIIDPLSRFAGFDAEKDNAVATRFIQALETLVPASGGASVLSSHHTNKLSRGPSGGVETSNARGSTALTDGARIVWTLGYEKLEHGDDQDADVRARLNEIVELAHTKSNYAPKADPLKLRRSGDHGGALTTLDEVDLQFVAAAKDVESKRKAKVGAKESERDEVRAERDRKEAERRARREADQEEATRRRDADDDEAARALIASNAKASVRNLVPLLKRARACGSDRAHAALVRVRGVQS